jgi:GNAT superfamily N-acetyltransferase
MISLHRRSDLSSILDLKAQYLKSLVAPMDGMWEVGFTNPAPHWEIRWNGEQAGYYAANGEGALLQFYVLPAFEKHGRALFDHVIAQDSLTQAVVSTIDPAFLSFCLDVQTKATVHTYLYEIHSEVSPVHPKAEGLTFRLIEAAELDRTIAFQQACLGSDKDLSGWLRGYSANLIERGELFVLCREDDWIGLGEYRRSDSQEGVVDLGMMVAPAHRTQGWATHILERLSAHATAEGLRAICSTTIENLGAQKAILRAGFISRHRILRVDFRDDLRH